MRDSDINVRLPNQSECIGLLLVGIILLAIASTKIYDYASTSLWEVTFGYITESEVVEVDFSENIGYRANVVYEYQVEGKLYSGSSIKIGTDFFVNNSFESAKSEISAYPVGEKVLVYFNHSNDGTSTTVLEFSLSQETYYFLGIGLLTFLIGGIGILKKW